jgi:hypothetical protein
MTATVQSRVLRVIGELTIIVVGVLLALAADAAWDAHNDRQRERTYLVALLAEMQTAQGELERDQMNRAERTAALDSLANRFDQAGADPESVTRWVLIASDLVFFLPPTAVYDDLVSSGSLRLLRSQELRLALMTYGQERSKLSLTEDRERTLIEGDLRPYLMDSFSIDSGPAPPALVNQLLGDRRFWNLATERQRRLVITLNMAQRVDTAIAGVIRLLENELGTGRVAS